MARKSSQGWLVTIGISAAIALVAAKFSTEIKAAVANIPVIGDYLNS